MSRFVLVNGKNYECGKKETHEKDREALEASLDLIQKIERLISSGGEHPAYAKLRADVISGVITDEIPNVVMKIGMALRYMQRNEASRHKECGTPTTEKSSAVGNAAAIHKALVNVRTYLLRSPYAVDEDGIMAEVVDALSAPARNCDRFNDRRSAFEYFRNNELWKYNRGLSAEYWFSEWLFAPAEKGAEHGE